MEGVLMEKEGDKVLEEKLGVKLALKFNTISFIDDKYVTIEPPPKEKTYTEKKKEITEVEVKA